MATIYAKFNSSSTPFNPLDPNMWVGGVVPGPDDIARFYYYQTTAGGSTFNGNAAYDGGYVYLSTTQYSNVDSTLEYDGPFSRNRFTSGSLGFTSSIWSGNYRRDIIGRHAAEINPNGNAYTYGANSSPLKYQKGFYYSQLGINATGTQRSYNKTTENNWNNIYKDRIQLYNGHYGPYYYRARMRTFYNYNYYGNYTSKFTFDGVTITVTGSVDGDYATGSRTFGVSKTEWLAAGNPYTRTDRMFDIITGSSLNVENGGRWKIYGPHNGRGQHNGNVLNHYSHISFWLVSESINSTPGMSGMTNGVQYSHDWMVATKYNYMPGHQYPPFTEPNVFHADSGSLFIFQEASGSMKYASASINADGDTIYNSDNNNHYTYFFSGSNNHLNHRLYSYYGVGIGPGNPGQVKLLFDDFAYGSVLVSPRIDPTYSTWVSASATGSTSYSTAFPMEYDTSNQVSGQWRTGQQCWTDTLIQKYVLSGSQHWQVGRIELSRYSHFHIKDQAKITLIDIESGTNYPCIDFAHWGGYLSTLLITDESTIEVSSSRTSLAQATECGIWHYDTDGSVLISGSANYSRSLAPSSSTAGDSTIAISNLQNCFGIGDYISIESTGSIKTKAISEDVATFFTGSEWYNGIYDSGSMDLLRGRNTNPSYYRAGAANPAVGPGYNTQYKNNHNWFVSRYYTNTAETDEIVQIATMSGDYATVIKMHGKEGEIQSDMGLYTNDQFVETFGEAVDTTYTGNKRVVLVDSNHLNFETGDNLVISGSSYNVLHATSYLSQSQFYEFTSSTQPPLEDVFDLEPAVYSGSSIWPVTLGTYGITSPTAYYTEVFKKDRLLITGSFKGSEFYQDKYKTSNAYNATRYGGSSGSSNGYRALRLDPTLTYGWRNWNGTSYYDYHSVESTEYLFGQYLLKDTFNFREGEIIVSGSILRDGNFDPTSSEAWDARNAFTVSWGETSIHGPHNSSQDLYNGKQAYYDQNAPYPYGHRVAFTYNTGPSISHGYYNTHANINLSDGRRFNGGTDANSSGSFLTNKNTNNPNASYRYIYSSGRKPIQDDPIFPAGLDFDSLWLSGSATYGDATASLNPGTGHIKVTLKNGHGKIYVGANGQEILFNKFFNEMGRGYVRLGLNMYGSIYSVNIKTRWQQLILDTTDSFNYRDRIKEGGILYDHYPNHEVKHIASEVVDAKGFKNLLWEEQYTKGNTNRKPYMFANCYSGATAGAPGKNGQRQVAEQYGPGRGLIPGGYIPSHLYSGYQNSDNFYIIYDLREQTQFDTVGMVFMDLTTYGYENDINNKMNNIRFEVTDDVGVDSPSWTTVVATYDDTRLNTGAGDIRFYTFPSGSVTKRFIKYHSRGGTSNAAYAQHSFFGLYNMSASCADTLTPAPNEDYTDSYGGPSGSLCQVELGDAKNFKVGDLVYFWSKQMSSGARLNKSTTAYFGYKNMQATTGWYDKSTPDEGFLGGVWNIHKITAKNGNIITLDKPITHNHIGAGTICYKYNRGNVTLKGDRAAPFNIYSTSQVNYKAIKNATFINGFSRKDQLGYNKYPDLIEDVGMMAYHESYYGYHGHGLYKNIIGNGPNNGGYTNAASDIFNIQRFNVMQTYGAQNFNSQLKIMGGGHKTVNNFGVHLNYLSYTGYIYGNSYYGAVGAWAPSYLRNMFILGGYLQSVSDYAAGGSVELGQTTFNLNDYIHVDGNVLGQRTEGGDLYEYRYSNNLRRDKNGELRSTKTSLPQFNQWYFPGNTNARMRPGVANWRAELVRRYGSMTTLGRFGARLYNGQVHDLFQGSDFVLIKNQYTKQAFFVPSENHETDKMYDLYPSIHNSLDIEQNNYTDIMMNCTFLVKEECDVRVDIDFTYIIDAFNVLYGNADTVSYATNRDYNQFGRSHPYISVINNDTQDLIDVTYLDKTTLTTLEKRDIHTLEPGTYSVNIHARSSYFQQVHHVMRVKNIDLKLVTPDLSKVAVIQSNWDALKLFDSVEHYSNENSTPSTQNAGANRVLKQTSDLTQNYKFNKIKL